MFLNLQALGDVAICLAVSSPHLAAIGKRINT